MADQVFSGGDLTITKQPINKPNSLGAWDIAGLATQGAGMLGNLINSIYQTSRGRVPLNIGSPLVGMGSLVGNIGDTIRRQKNQQATLGIIEQSKLPPEVQAMIAQQIVGNPEEGMKTAVTAMTRQPNMTELYVKAAQGDPTAKKALVEYMRANPPGGGSSISISTGQMKNAGRLAELEVKIGSGMASPQEEAEYKSLRSIVIKAPTTTITPEMLQNIGKSE